MTDHKSDIEWKPVEATNLSREEAIRFMNGGAEAEITAAFADGVLVGYEKRVLPNEAGDLEIRMVIRHRSALPKEDAE